MMKAAKWTLIALSMTAPLVAQASCDSVEASISQKIGANGVAASDFTLEVVPNDRVDSAQGLVVGHCENDSQKIVYRRNGTDKGQPAATSSQNAPQPEAAQ